MRVTVHVTVKQPTEASETVEVDEAEYQDWRGGQPGTPARLLEYLRAGEGKEFEDARVWAALTRYGDEGEFKRLEVHQ